MPELGVIPIEHYDNNSAAWFLWESGGFLLPACPNGLRRVKQKTRK